MVSQLNIMLERESWECQYCENRKLLCSEAENLYEVNKFL